MCAIGRAQTDEPDTRRLVALAGRQHGQVSTAQLAELGFDKDRVQWRVDRGDWIRRHRGVVSVASGYGQQGEWMAAVLACADGAALDEWAAATHHGFGPARPPTTVLIPFGAPAGPSTVRTHRSRTFDPRTDAMVLDGIPVTTPERTLIDLAARASKEELLKALHDAKRLRLITEGSMRSAIGRAGRRPGIGVLRTLLDDLVNGYAHEELERLFIRMAAKAGWTYRRNVPMVFNGRPRRADAVFDEAKLMVELDGRASHEWNFVDDRDRDLDAALHGVQTVRLGKWHLTTAERRTRERVDELLRVRSTGPSPTNRAPNA